MRKNKNAKEALELIESITYGLKRLGATIEERGAIISAETHDPADEEHQVRLLKAMRNLDNELTWMTVPDLM